MRLSDAVMVAPLDFLRLPLIAVAGALIYAEPLDPLVLLGGAVILAGNLWSLMAEHRRQKQLPGAHPGDAATLVLSDGSAWTAHALLPTGRPEFLLDTSGLNCPMPILKAKKAYRDLPVGRMMEVIATDPLAVDDFKDFCIAHKATLMLFRRQGGIYQFLIRRDA
jgi:tRNA 2-thiouridine synthesizing protein A